MKIRVQISTLTTVAVMFFIPAMGQGIDDKIQIIKKRFTSINTDNAYSIVTLDNEEFLEQMTDGGGQLKGYLKGGGFSKIYENIGLSYCIQIREYYFWDNKLIFVFEKEDDFALDSLGTIDHTKTKAAFEGRYYFDNGKLISTKTKGEKLMSDSVAFDSQSKEGQLLSLAQSRIDLLTDKRK